jgi:hypothetical protein
MDTTIACWSIARFSFTGCGAAAMQNGVRACWDFRAPHPPRQALGGCALWEQW